MLLPDRMVCFDVEGAAATAIEGKLLHLLQSGPSTWKDAAFAAERTLHLARSAQTVSLRQGR